MTDTILSNIISSHVGWSVSVAVGRQDRRHTTNSVKSNIIPAYVKAPYMQLLSKCLFNHSFLFCVLIIIWQERVSNQIEGIELVFLKFWAFPIIWTCYSMRCPILSLLGKSRAISQPFVVHLSPLSPSLSQSVVPETQIHALTTTKKCIFYAAPSKLLHNFDAGAVD